MRVLVTGGAGFIGSNFIHLLLEEGGPDLSVLNLDKLTYAGNLGNLADVADDSRYSFLRGDICDRETVEKAFLGLRPEAVVHFAAETHVDRSIQDSSPFVITNVLGTQVLLSAAQKADVRRFLHISTDEVYGTLREDESAFTEDRNLSPNSPYAASKASSDLLALAYHRTHGMDVVVTRCSNNYGPFQFPEKLIPLMIENALAGKPLPVYGKGVNIRDWIHVTDHCRAILRVLGEGKAGQVYNIGGNAERRNLDVVKGILRSLGKDESLIRFVTDRPGHDFRYAIDNGRIRSELGWKPAVTFEEGLENTMAWYLDHRDWVSKVVSGDYRSYYDKMYGQRLGE